MTERKRENIRARASKQKARAVCTRSRELAARRRSRMTSLLRPYVSPTLASNDAPVYRERGRARDTASSREQRVENARPLLLRLTYEYRAACVRACLDLDDLTAFRAAVFLLFYTYCSVMVCWGVGLLLFLSSLLF